MALVVGTNSYINATDADLYFADRLNSTTWTDATPANKDLALIYATSEIDKLAFLGSRYSSTQSLKFPRTDLYYDGVALSSSVVPQQVLDATCEVAMYLLDNPTATSQNKGDLDEFSRVKVGSIEIDIKQTIPLQGVPSTIKPMLYFAMASRSRLFRG